MNGAYLHLLVNHLPVAGILFTTVLLGVATVRRTPESAEYGYAGLVAVGVLAIVAYITGNFAPPALAHAPGAALDRITYHQITAAVGMILAALVAVLAWIPLVLTGIATKRGVLIAYLVLAVALDVLFAYVASTGGAIRHSEIR
jgi:uncharacterized protein YacL